MSSNNLNELCLNTLKEVFGFSKYRDGQREIIESILHNKNILAVMPTGAGKSLCYQLPAIISEKKTIVISPLIALMDDQIDSLRDYGVSVEAIHSNLSNEDNKKSWNNFREGKSKIIYMSPERLMTSQMLKELKDLDIGLFVIDEAHCVSKWGQSFRKDYEELSQIKKLFPESNIAGFTATADRSTRQDIVEKIFHSKPIVFVKGFDRPNLSLAIALKNDWKKQLIDFLSIRKKQSGIVYCLSRKKTEEVSQLLNKEGFRASAYHAGMKGDLRKNVQNIFMTEHSHIVVATIAFGMGIDKPDIRFVVHVNLPGSMEAYYQEIGRAGRDGNSSDTLLIYGLDDLVLRRRMIEESDSDNDYKLREHKRLDYLLSYCEAPDCRRKALLNYFDDECKVCGNCDNCNNPTKLIDGSELAQKLLSTIYRTGQYFGQVHIINVLRGSNDNKVYEKGHDQLSVYGIGQDKSKVFWQSFLRQLLAFGHLQINFQKFGAIEITPSGMDILTKGISFSYKEIIEKNYNSSPKMRGINSINFSENDINLISNLKKLRLEIAKKQGQPAYTVFHDNTLKQIAEFKPKSEDDFLKIDGVGLKKYQKYGKRFREEIELFLKEK